MDDYSVFGISVKLFEKVLENKSLNTQKAYENCLKKIIHAYGSTPITEITPYMIENFPGGVLTKRVFKRLFFFAYEEGLITRDRIPRIRIPKEKQRTRYLRQHEIESLINNCKDYRLRMAIIIGLSTGLRKENIFALKWTDFDFDNKLLRVVTKGNKEMFIPLIEGLVERLKEFRRGRPSIHKKLFPEGNIYNAKFRRLCDRIGLRDVCFHTLRHSFGSMLAMNGVHIVTIAELMGHASLETTKRYTHVSTEAKREAVDSLTKGVMCLSNQQSVENLM
jgi:integrase